MALRSKILVRGLLLWLLVFAIGPVHAETDAAITAYLSQQPRPVDYVLSKATSHRITLLGEGHWLAQDVTLVAALVPLLALANVDLAVETLQASDQPRIDALISAPRWDEPAANALLRSASWPYLEYRDLLHAAWTTNRGSATPIKIVALGPSADWASTLLPRGITYDSFMADLLAAHVAASGRRVVAYCGMHHSFTRYYQAELDLAGRASSYMDRMGNILWRRFGERVFLIALHKPIWCGDPGQPSYCLPLGARLDCAAAMIGRSIGFDIVGSPLADLRFEASDYYAFGHPGLRFGDYADGYVWSGPIESFRQVNVMPLREYAPDEAALAQVRGENPFTDEVDASLARLEEIWAEQIAASRNPLATRKWSHLAGWQSLCSEQPP